MAEDVRARRENIRAKMHQFYKLSPSKDTVASPTTETTSSLDASIELETHNIDSPNFDSTAYATNILQHATIKGLYEKDTSLRREVRSLDGDLQDLVYRNYSKFINATDTIKQMRDNVVDIDQKLQSLSSNVRDITTVSNAISSNLEAHRSKIEEMLERNRMLQKIKFLVELPVTLRKYITEKQYAVAVDEWVNGDAFLKKCDKITSFHKTHEECRTIARELWNKFEESVILVDAKGVDISKTTSGAISAKYSSKNTFQEDLLSQSGSQIGESTATCSYHTADVMAKIRDNANNIVKSVVKLQLLSRTSIFTPEEQPQCYARHIYIKILERRESCLKKSLKNITSKFHSDLKSAISNLPIITSLKTNVSEYPEDNIFAQIVRSLESFSPDSIYPRLNCLFADFVIQSTIILESIEPCFEPSPLEEKSEVTNTAGRIILLIQPLLFNLASELLSSYAQAAIVILNAIISQQSRVMDSHRSASEAAVLVQSVCVEGHRAITGHMRSLTSAFKRLGADHLSTIEQSEVADFCNKVEMVELRSSKIISSALYRYKDFNPLSECCVSSEQKEAADRVSDPQKLAYDVRFNRTRNVLVASLLARLFAATPGQNDCAISPCVSIQSKERCEEPPDTFERVIAQKSNVSVHDHFKETCIALLQHFIVLLTQHFGLLLQNVYLPSICPTKENIKANANGPSGTHEVFYTIYAQWAALHAATRHWFPDGETAESFSQLDRHDNRHIRQSSLLGVTARKALPTTAQFQARAPNSGNTTPEMMRIFYEKLQNTGHLTLLPQLHQNDKSCGVQWGALEIQDAVILSTMVTFLESLRSHPLGCFTTPLSTGGHIQSTAFQQLQVDLSFTLQQVSTNVVFWLKDDTKFVSLINEIAAEAYRQSCSGAGGSQPLGIAVVEKLARSDV